MQKSGALKSEDRSCWGQKMAHTNIVYDVFFCVNYLCVANCILDPEQVDIDGSAKIVFSLPQRKSMEFVHEYLA